MANASIAFLIALSASAASTVPSSSAGVPRMRLIRQRGNPLELGRLGMASIYNRALLNANQWQEQKESKIVAIDWPKDVKSLKYW